MTENWWHDGAYWYEVYRYRGAWVMDDFGSLHWVGWRNQALEHNEH